MTVWAAVFVHSRSNNSLIGIDETGPERRVQSASWTPSASPGKPLRNHFHTHTHSHSHSHSHTHTHTHTHTYTHTQTLTHTHILT